MVAKEDSEKDRKRRFQNETFESGLENDLGRLEHVRRFRRNDAKRIKFTDYLIILSPWKGDERALGTE